MCHFFCTGFEGVEVDLTPEQIAEKRAREAKHKKDYDQKRRNDPVQHAAILARERLKSARDRVTKKDIIKGYDSQIESEKRGHELGPVIIEP